MQTAPILWLFGGGHFANQLIVIENFIKNKEAQNQKANTKKFDNWRICNGINPECRANPHPISTRPDIQIGQISQSDS